MSVETPSHGTAPLHGVRIWLAGAVPSDGTGAQKASLVRFVREFATAVFSEGGHILHGSHPSLVGPLIEQAKDHIARGGRKDCLTLAVSRYWSRDRARVPVQEWRQTCMVYETAEATGGPSARDDSIEILRQWMADRCDVFVAVGGQWWQQVAGRAGIPIEAGMAMQRGLPCFLLGGLGGAAADYVRDHPEIIGYLKNGIDDAANQRLALQEDVGSLVNDICGQLSRLPLVRGRVSDGISFRILALDGGGIKGAFTAAALTTMEQSLGVPVASQFDLVAGTSTGGILAIGLGMGLHPDDMLKFYRDRGPIVFPAMRFYRKWRSQLRHMLSPKYSQNLLRRELEQAYFRDGKHKLLGDSVCRLVIPAYDAISGVCHVFRTPHHELLSADHATDAVEVALATAAAPTYFSSAIVRNLVSDASFFDGGVWANCPAMAAIIEAVCYLGVPLDRIDVLSIGTTEEPFTVKSMAQAGWARWGKTLIDLLMNAQVDSAVRHAQLLVGEPRFLRVNTMTTPGMYAIDGSREIENLIALGNRKASDPEILYQVKSRFLNRIDAMDWRLKE
ncbi:CBASS cGAMP-activated phospholipase [Bradyrhizobium sp. Tv2a-2]|uniref:CBASS cGAMP-activated phospholipase n=1 Tax=Bradyrhizobium sp. Tv2a-2 TaxID=113395 RepID=UPI000402989C